jgi:short-subunit dehydrogenase
MRGVSGFIFPWRECFPPPRSDVMKLEGCRIILTGAASGIGKALLHQLSRLEVQVVASDMDAGALKDAVQQLPAGGNARIEPFACDVADPLQVDRLFEHAVRSLGGVDLFFANAGFAYYERMGEPDWERLERIYRVNVLSPLYSARKMATLNAGRRHRVVFTASAMGMIALPGYAVYGSTKAALHHFADAYRFEVSDASSLTLVYPIGTRTGFFRAAATRAAPQPWPTQSPQQVARAILVGIRRDARVIHPSSLFRFMALAQRIAPPVKWIIQTLEKRRFRRWLADDEARGAPS